MAKRTFKFTGSPDMKKYPYDEILFHDPESGEDVILKPGKTFTTEHPTLQKELEEREDMEEVDAGDKRANDGKSTASPKTDVKRS